VRAGRGVGGWQRGNRVCEREWGIGEGVVNAGTEVDGGQLFNFCSLLHCRSSCPP